jgi:hypothetical protein
LHAATLFNLEIIANDDKVPYLVAILFTLIAAHCFAHASVDCGHLDARCRTRRFGFGFGCKVGLDVNIGGSSWYRQRST